MRYICTSIVATLVLAGTSFAATINVPADYPTIQAAVDAASNGDTVLVAQGTYTDTQDGHVVDMKAKAITLRSTDGAAVTIIDGQNVRRGIACYQGETNTTVIDGFTITNGFGVEYDYNDNGGIDQMENSGGGIYCSSSSPTITDCTISNNTANYGGGIYCTDSSPLLDNCTFVSNTSYGGAGTYFEYSDPTIFGCTFANNIAEAGGAMVAWGSNVTINNCVISGNEAKTEHGDPGSGHGTGGGIVMALGGAKSTLMIHDCDITDNVATFHGGGIYETFYAIGDSDTHITDCTFENNSAGEEGGGMYISRNFTLTNCTFDSNTAAYGGGMFNRSSSPTLSNCVVTDNTATIEGGGIFNDSNSDSVLSNTSVCGNTPDQVLGDWTDNGGNTISDECPPDCPDVDGDGMVGVNDVLAVVAAWGSDDPDADVDGDGLVGTNDILAVLSAWGSCE